MAIAHAAPSGYLERPRPERTRRRHRPDPRQGARDRPYVRVSLVGIELLTIDARIVVASVDTYLRFAEAVNRLDLSDRATRQALPGAPGRPPRGRRASKTKGALEGAKDKLGFCDR